MCQASYSTHSMHYAPSLVATAGTWTVIVGALVASTLLNCIFPFFTYVPSSGSFGELLPQASAPAPSTNSHCCCMHLLQLLRGIPRAFAMLFSNAGRLCMRHG